METILAGIVNMAYSVRKKKKENEKWDLAIVTRFRFGLVNLDSRVLNKFFHLNKKRNHLY